MIFGVSPNKHETQLTPVCIWFLENMGSSWYCYLLTSIVVSCIVRSRCIFPLSDTYCCCNDIRRWSGGAIVVGLDDSRERAFCACSRCKLGLFGHI